MDKTLRMLMAGIVAGFILFLVVSLVYHYTGSISDPSISKLFKETISMKWFYKLLLLNIGSGIIMAFFYAMIANGLPGSGIFKGVFWGFIVWLIMVHQPMILHIVAGKFNTNLLLTWVLQGLTSYVAAGVSISIIYKQ
ncbi:MAG TPA: hypothetical protein P5511_00980 [Candidatus Goldiibacteriota bacterium]|nr:hypothetical protein [Candidatus Goldiibacteriota bacterium]